MSMGMRKEGRWLLLALVATACAPSVGTIDRTQPLAVNKSQFEGLWYYRASVISVEAGEGDAIEGTNSGLDKIRWDITENLLVGYRSYEFLPFAEGLTDDGRDFFGAPVVAYRILSQFDIQRDYNRTTGVENNVIVENSTDRPWYEREYIRVDWTQNVVGGATQLATGWENYPEAYFSGTALSSYSIPPNEETNPDRPIFTKNYFDVTNDYHVEPDQYYCSLLLLSNGQSRCGGQDVKVRLSFRKIDPTDDYQSLYYPDSIELKDPDGDAIVLDSDGRVCDASRNPDGCSVATFPVFESFGNFRINRLAYDSERGFTRTGRIYLAGRFDLWKDSYRNDTGELIPYEMRTPQPIVYYATTNMPDDIFPGAQDLAAAWNKPFMETVAYLQGMRTADQRGDIAALQAKYGPDFRMYEIRRNDCSPDGVAQYIGKHGLQDIQNRVLGNTPLTLANVTQVCAAIQYAELQAGKTLDPSAAKKPDDLAFQWQRLGDLRYNFQHYSNQYSTSGGLWGIAQMSSDPETGEYISNVANYFAKAGDTISQGEVDRIQWLNGQLDDTTLLRGDVARNVVVSHRDARNAAIHDTAKRGLMAHDAAFLRSSGSSAFAPTPTGSADARFSAMFKGTSLERELLVNDQMLRGFAGPSLYQPGSAALDSSSPSNAASGSDNVSDSALAAASPVGWGIGMDKNTYWKAFRELAARNFEFADFFDPITDGLAEQQRTATREETYNYLRKSLYAAVEAHEVGHALGLRHNFGASMDPLNYAPEFWRQYWNHPPTSSAPNRGPEYKYASIMDYGFGTSTEGLHGIGAYDEAAIRFIYGELVDVWDENKVTIPDARKYGSFARRCGQGSDFPGLASLIQFLGWESLPALLTSTPRPNGDSPIETVMKRLVSGVESNAGSSGDVSSCALFTTQLNTAFGAVKNLPAQVCSQRGDNTADCPDRVIQEGADRIVAARKLVPLADLVAQRRDILIDVPEYDNPATAIRDDATTIGCIEGDESGDCKDQDSDGVPDDRGFGCQWNPSNRTLSGCYANVYHVVPYTFCPDEYSGFSPGCQPFDHGADFLESTQSLILRYDRDYIFSNFRRDAYNPQGWGSAKNYMSRLEGRTLFAMTNVFRYYLYSRGSTLDAPQYARWAEATYRGINFLERIIQTPEPGTYCLDRAKNLYLPKPQTTGTCEDPFEVGIGYEQGKYHDQSWSNDYNYKSNRIGVFFDKLAAIRQMTNSAGRFVRDLSDLFDARAFTLGYMRVYEDPIVQRFSALIQGKHDGYRSAVVTELDPGGNPIMGADGKAKRYVRYMPLFDEQREDGSSVHTWLTPLPKIEPSWSWTLQYIALGYAITNFSSIADSAPEFYHVSKIAIEGTPEDIDYGPQTTLVRFVDPETRISYVAPAIPAQSRQMGDAASLAYLKTHEWGIGAEILADANRLLEKEWTPAKAACEAASASSAACATFAEARRKLNEQVSLIDNIRRFNRVAEQRY